MDIFDQSINTENSDVEVFLDIEDLYQAFKKRLIEEVKVESDMVSFNIYSIPKNLIDISNKD